MNGQTNASGGGGGYKEYTGQMTLASGGMSVTIPNPFGSAKSVRHISFDFFSSETNNLKILWVRANKATNVIHYGLKYNGSENMYYYMNSRHDKEATIEATDSEITIKFTRNGMPNGDLAWEVTGYE